MDRDFIRIADDKARRIGKEQLYKIFKLRYPTSLITQSQLISSLKDKGFTYMSDMRYKQVKGCFLGIVLSNDWDNDDVEDVKDDDLVSNLTEYPPSIVSERSNPMKKFVRVKKINSDKSIFCSNIFTNPKTTTETFKDDILDDVSDDDLDDDIDSLLDIIN